MGRGTYSINMTPLRTLPGTSIGVTPSRREFSALSVASVYTALYPVTSTPGRTYPSPSPQINLAMAYSAVVRSSTETTPPVSSTTMSTLRTASSPSTPSTPTQHRTSTLPIQVTVSRSPSTPVQSSPTTRHSSVTLKSSGTRLVVNGS